MSRAANGEGLAKARTKPASAICGAVSFRVQHGIPGTRHADADAIAKFAERRQSFIKKFS